MKRARTSVIIDINDVISSLWGGYPRKVIDMWQAGRMTLVTTLDILSEYFDVIRRFNPAPEIEEEFLLLFMDVEKTLFVKPVSNVEVIRDDPDDNKFLAGAEAGNADCIISGDRHLLKLGRHKKAMILSPKDFFLLNSN